MTLCSSNIDLLRVKYSNILLYTVCLVECPQLWMLKYQTPYLRPLFNTSYFHAMAHCSVVERWAMPINDPGLVPHHRHRYTLGLVSERVLTIIHLIAVLPHCSLRTNLYESGINLCHPSTHALHACWSRNLFCAIIAAHCLCLSL